MDNPRFRFLYDRNTEGHQYYRWRVLANFYKSDDTNYRREPFNLTVGGNIFYPPELYEQPT